MAKTLKMQGRFRKKESDVRSDQNFPESEQMIEQATQSITVTTSGQALYEVTREIADWMNDQSIAEGMFTLYCRHTSASLVIQENADPNVMADLQTFFQMLVPEDFSLYRHRSEGSDDMPAHIKGALTQSSLAIPVSCGRLMLGTWQGIYLFEHRTQPHRRELLLHVIGE
jgi:secondary thiamine-phosphate synthase enzyme